MPIYTRQGDRGETSLLGGKRVSKGDLQVEAYGTVDELSSFLGLARGLARHPRVREELQHLQETLFSVAGELAAGPEGLRHLSRRVTAEDIRQMEEQIDRLQAEHPLPGEFVLPGGSPSTGALDVARTVARRAERLAVRLGQQQEVREELLAYLNRVSDLLWVLARVEDREDLVEAVKGRVLARLQPAFGLDLETARQLTDAAFARAQGIGVPMVVALCDQGGNLLTLQRQDGALLASIDIARDKAFTAVALRLPTHEVTKLAQPGQSLYGIATTNGGRLVIFGGGYPLWRGDRLVGAIGVSGGTVAQDMEVAEAGLSWWERHCRSDQSAGTTP